jgi:hypothetical protein
VAAGAPLAEDGYMAEVTAAFIAAVRAAGRRARLFATERVGLSLNHPVQPCGDKILSGPLLGPSRGKEHWSASPLLLILGMHGNEGFQFGLPRGRPASPEQNAPGRRDREGVPARPSAGPKSPPKVDPPDDREVDERPRTPPPRWWPPPNP